MPNTCATCRYWRIPVSETRRICLLLQETSHATDSWLCHSAYDDVPFTDPPEVDDEQARRELRGEGL